MKENTPQKAYLVQPIFYIGTISTNGGNINFADHNSTIIDRGIVGTMSGENSGQLNMYNTADISAQIVTLQYQVQLLQEQIKELCRRFELTKI